MLEVKLYNQEGKIIGTEKLDPTVFSLKPNPVLIQQVVVAQQANQRVSYAHTKRRGEVKGGGAKPWRQKGTGRARHGSIRSPLWKGGGVTFGPRKDRNFRQKVNKKAKRKALLMSLSDKAVRKKIVVVDEIKLEKAKTKEMKKILSSLPTKTEKTLIVLPKSDIKIIRSTNNLSFAHPILADSLNVVDVLAANFLLIAQKSLEKIKKTFAK